MTYHPAEWDDDERMVVLMGRMPPPTEKVAYNNRILFWSDAIHRWVKEKRCYTFSVKDAEEAFKRGTRVPLCLKHVVEHLRRQGELLTYGEFNQLSMSESWLEWTQKNVIFGPPKWIWQRVQSTIVGSQETEKIIDWKSLQEASDESYSFIWKSETNLELLLPLEILLKTFSHFIKGLSDLQLIIECLQKKGLLTTTLQDGEMLVKFSNPGAVEPPRVSSTDIALHKLYSTQHLLNERLSSCQKELEKSKSEAKNLLLNGMKNQALIVFRRKKRLDSKLEKTAISLENITQCIEQIQESAVNKELLKTFQLGASCLKSILSETGNLDEVSDAMSGLQDTLDECNEVAETISNPISDGTTDDDLELELEQMLKDLTIAETLSEKDTTLPDIPSFNPLPSNENKFSSVKLMESP